MDDDLLHTPGAAGLDAVIGELGLVIDDDLELVPLTDHVADGLYAWVQPAVS